MTSTIQVEIYKDTAPDVLLAIIDARQEPATLSELKSHGAGSFLVSKRNPKVAAEPLLLDYRNMVRLVSNGEVIGGFVIKNKRTVIVAEGERSEEYWSVSGEGFRSWVEDATVHPENGISRLAGETRYFNFSSMRGSWYDSNSWKPAVSIKKWNTPGSIWGGYPAEWPDVPNAYYIWSRPTTPSTYPGNTTGAHPVGYSYFRCEFNAPHTSGMESYAFLFGIDDSGEVYLDGEQLATVGPHGFYETNRVDFELAPGPHVIAVRAYNYKEDGPGGLIGTIMRYGDPAKPTSAQVVTYTGQNTWRALDYPERAPGWTVGDVLLTLIDEAKPRGVRFANNITPTFNEDVDSDGVPWLEQQEWSFDVGTTYGDVISTLEETSADVYLNPATLELDAWNSRGIDRSMSGGSWKTFKTNYVYNPTFDQGRTNGWNAFGSGTTIEAVTNQHYSGTHSMKVITGGANGGVRLATSKGNVGVSRSPVGAHVFSCYIYQPNVGTISVVLQEVTREGVSVGSPVTTTFSDSGAWRRAQGTITKTRKDTYIQASLRTPDAATFYVDAAMMERGTVPSSPFSGDTPTPNPDTDEYRWTGLAELSPSIWVKKVPEENVVQFIPGHNLTSGDETGQADIINSILLRTTDGWAQKFHAASKAKYGTIETQFTSTLNEKATQPFITEMFRAKANPEKSATFEIFPKPGSVPFKDFNVGDIVYAPTDTPGVMANRRIMSIAATEDSENARVVYAVEFDIVFKDRQADLEKWLSRVSHSSSSNSGWSVGGSLPPTSQIITPGKPAPAEPAYPSGLQIQSNVGQWTKDGKATSVVTMAWDPVTMSVDGQPLDTNLYEMWSRTASEESTLTSQTQGLSATVRSWQPEVLRLVKVRARSVSGKWSQFSPEIPVIPAMPTSIVPKPPTGVAASQEAKYTPGGAPRSKVTLSWNAVTQSTDDTDVEIESYEVWEQAAPGEDYLFKTSVRSGLQIVFEIPSTPVRAYRVRAISKLRVAGDLSDPVTVTPGVPPIDTTPPSTPILSPSVATIEVTWDGKMTGGATPGAWVAHILTQTAPADTGPWLTVGAPLDRRGSNQVRGEVGTPIFFRFQATDSLGRSTGVSEVVSASVTGVAIGDIDQSIQDAIDQAQDDAANALLVASTADGRVTVSPEEPVAADGIGKSLGSVWFLRSPGGMFIGVWEWTALGWVSRQLEDAVIATLDAAKIVTGFLDAARIAANTITVSKLFVGSFENLVIDPSGLFPIADSWVTYAGDISEWSYFVSSDKGNVLHTLGNGIGKRLVHLNRIQVRPGERYVITANTQVSPNWVGRNPALRMVFRNATGGLVAGGYTRGAAFLSEHPDSWEPFSYIATVPDHVSIVYADLEIEILPENTAGSTLVADIVWKKAVTSEIIVDGAVTARTLNVEEIWANEAWLGVLRAGVIETPMLSSGVGRDLQIQGNESITLMVGRIDQNASDIENAQASASDAASLADAAQAQADGAVAQALEALNAASAVQGDLGDMQAVYQFTTTSANITTPGGEQVLRLSPTRISLEKNGQILTYWEGQQMVVQQGVFDGISVANHRMDPNGTGRTVFRPL